MGDAKQQGSFYNLVQIGLHLLYRLIIPIILELGTFGHYLFD